MTHLLEACAICIALLVMWMAWYVADQTGWLWVHSDQVDGLIGIACVAQSALVCLVKGVLRA